MRDRAGVPSISLHALRESSCPTTTMGSRRIMLSELLEKASLFHLLHVIDTDLAICKRQEGCPYCGGPLHQANYRRKPRGGPPVPEHYCIRRSLCCGREGCRRRCAPESCLFMGRRVYWRCVVLVVMALRQRRPDGSSAGQLVRLFGISRKTLKRWFDYFREAFAQSREWQRVRGRLNPCVTNERLPATLLDYCIESSQDAQSGLVVCCRLLAVGG
jgi:hypothetical protein